MGSSIFSASKQHLYIESPSQVGSDVRVALNEFRDNDCQTVDCKSVEIIHYHSLAFQGELAEASEIRFIDKLLRLSTHSKKIL